MAQSTVMVMLGQSVYLTTLFLARLNPLSSQPVLLNIFLQETDNSPSSICGSERRKSIAWKPIITHKVNDSRQSYTKLLPGNGNSGARLSVERMIPKNLSYYAGCIEMS